MGSGGEQEWRKTADTHKMSQEEVKNNLGVEWSKRPPGHNPGDVLHQRRNLPFSVTSMTAVGFLMAAGIGYGVLYASKKHKVSALDVAKVTAAVADPADTRPRGKTTQPEDTSLENKFHVFCCSFLLCVFFIYFFSFGEVLDFNTFSVSI